MEFMSLSFLDLQEGGKTKIEIEEEGEIPLETLFNLYESIPRKRVYLRAIEGGNLVALEFKGEVKSYLCRTNEGKVLLCCYVELPHPTSKAEVRNDFFFHYDLVHTCLEFETSVGKIRLSQPAIF